MKNTVTGISIVDMIKKKNLWTSGEDIWNHWVKKKKAITKKNDKDILRSQKDRWEIQRIKEFIFYIITQISQIWVKNYTHRLENQNELWLK
jgi:hypothetical protein